MLRRVHGRLRLAGMDITLHDRPDSPPLLDTEETRARFAAARADYLAGGSGPEVCERHGLSLSTFRWRAKKEGWRRADQPAPSLAPAPTSQTDPLVIPDASPGASRDGTPLTAAQMVDKAWSHVQAAVAAGHLIQARGWLRLYKELKPYARYEEIEAREAAAREADTPSPPPDQPEPAADLNRLTARLAAVTRQVEEAAHEAEVGLQLHCFQGAECNTPDQGQSPSPSPSGSTGGPRPADRAEPDTGDTLTRLVAELEALTRQTERALADETVRLQLHCFSDAECNSAGPGP